MVFKINMCFLDRTLRVVAGFVLLYFAFFDTTLLNNMYIKILIGFFGLLNMGSAFFGHCPIYNLANLSTVKKSDHSE